MQNSRDLLNNRSPFRFYQAPPLGTHPLVIFYEIPFRPTSLKSFLKLPWAHLILILKGRAHQKKNICQKMSKGAFRPVSYIKMFFEFFFGKPTTSRKSLIRPWYLLRNCQLYKYKQWFNTGTFYVKVDFCCILIDRKIDYSTFSRIAIFLDPIKRKALPSWLIFVGWIFEL